MISFYLQMIETQEDRDKFEVLYIEYGQLMYEVAFRILHNVEDSEDATHNAFVAVATNIKKIDGTVCPRTQSYLVTIAENKAIDTYRFKSRHQEEPYTEDNVGLEVDYSGAVTAAYCFLKLRARYRHVLTLKYEYGFKNKEIARMMGTTEYNVKKLEQRAKSELRKICEKEGLV